ncbi:MAG: DUF6265 family protein [candidate division Zixibacteria bacterium]|jgi:hypothetical protein|nr:DUF6265 family protein [candidate division Zixibacteria bacterium]
MNQLSVIGHRTGKSRAAMVIAAAAVVSFCSLAAAFTGPKQIAQLHWLEGHWRGMLGENVFEAIYTSPEGGQILSVSKEFPPDRPAFVEFERFHMVDSFVVMTPYPGGRESVSFTMTAFDSEARLAKFSNPDHDFPNDIIYQAIGGDSLVIEVTGVKDDGTRTGFTVNLRRIR